MKVLFLLPAEFPEGPANAKHIQRLAYGLREAGICCEVICLTKSPSGNSSGQDPYGTEFSSVFVGASPAARRARKLLLSGMIGRRVKKAITDRGITHVWMYGPSWLFWRSVLRVCRDSRIPAIAHLTEWWPPETVQRRLYWDQELFLKFCWEKLNGVVAISTPWLKYAEMRMTPVIRVPVPCPIDSLGNMRHKPRDEANQKITLLYSGQLYRRDLPGVMLEAVRGAMRRIPALRFTVLGQSQAWPEGREFCREVKADSQIAGRITIPGYVSPEEYANYLDEADMFLLLHDDSKESMACFPTRLPEMLSSGKPVIVSGVGDIPDYLEHGKHCLLISRENSAAEVEETICRLAGDAHLRSSLGATGRKHCLDVFSPVRWGKDLKGFLEKIRIPQP